MNQPGWAPLPLPPAPPPAPYFAAPPPPPPKPSGGYKALGIIQAALGASGALWSAASIALSAVLTTRVASVYTPLMLAVTYGRLATNLLTGVLLVVTGIGVFRAKRWARWVGVAYAALSLFESIAGAALNMLLMMPASLGGAGATRSFQTIMIVTSVATVLVYAVLPIVTLVALLRKKAAEELDQ